MDWQLDKKRPICPQICEKLCVLIASGEIGAGERLMSVREVASDAGVTPTTVQKSFEQLEQQGIIFSKRGSGWYVSEHTGIAKDMLSTLIRAKTVDYLNDMQALGLDKKEIIQIIKDFRYR
ncbi:GntR family transcriptional regulator [Ruminococcus sp.]|uniref:GntR family transcriptional regulator n=1 Tax=Ruminococcus sp. TaxID=41978 RepID=UPI00388EB310